MIEVAAQYRTDENLRARIETHQHFTVGPDLEPAVDAALQLTGEESLLDVGTGRGDFPGRLAAAGHRGEIVGLDQQAGMVEAAHAKHPGLKFLRGEADSLPFADARFDVVTARHMLYHVPNIPAALVEMLRVLKPGGTFLAITNAHDSMAVFWEIVADAASVVPELLELNREMIGLRFTDRNGNEYLRNAFGNAQETRLPSRLEFPSPEPVERYFRSCLPGSSVSDPSKALAAFHDALRARWPRTGPFVVPKTILLFTAVRS